MIFINQENQINERILNQVNYSMNEGTTVRHEHELELYDGSNVNLIGVYTPIKTSRKMRGASEYLGAVVIQIGNKTIRLGASYRDKSEIEEFKGRVVKATGRLEMAPGLYEDPNVCQEIPPPTLQDVSRIILFKD
jgi:hypothetical protein